jgi:hypothetical protein
MVEVRMKKEMTKWSRFGSKELLEWVRAAEAMELIFEGRISLDTENGVQELRRRGLIRPQAPKSQFSQRLFRQTYTWRDRRYYALRWGK